MALAKEDFEAYLKKINFQKHLKKIEKILKNKKIVIYGAGAFFQTINENYDLSKLNIIAISDRKFLNPEKKEEFLGYKICSPFEIAFLKPDYVLIGMLNFIDVIKSLEDTYLKNSKIKIKPLINKPFAEVLKEILGL